MSIKVTFLTAVFLLALVLSSLTSASAQSQSPAGNYVCKVNPPGGSAKLLPNGTVICSSGEKGTWEVFDADTRAYVISVAGGRYNVIFQPGRGFVDAIDKNLLFEAKAPVK